MQTLTPKNWAAFQHYKDRSPAWIKLHRGILDDYDFHCLQDASKALAPLLWLLASEYEGGQIPFDVEKIAFRMRMPTDKLAAALKPLIDKGFFNLSQGASEVLAECLPREREEREKEIEVEKKEKKRAGKPSMCSADLVSQGVKEKAAAEWLEIRKRKRLPLTPLAWESFVAEAGKAGWTLDDAVMKCIARGWATFEAEWVARESRQQGFGMPAMNKQEALEANNRAIAERLAKKYEQVTYDAQ